MVMYLGNYSFWEVHFTNNYVIICHHVWILHFICEYIKMNKHHSVSQNDRKFTGRTNSTWKGSSGLVDFNPGPCRVKGCVGLTSTLPCHLVWNEMYQIVNLTCQSYGKLHCILMLLFSAHKLCGQLVVMVSMPSMCSPVCLCGLHLCYTFI